MNAQSKWTAILLSVLLLASCGQGSETAVENSSATPQPSAKSATVAVDILRLPGPSSQYSITLASNGYNVSAPGRASVVLPPHIKRVDFDDTSYGIGSNSNTAQVYRVWRAALNRTPDLNGYSYWVNLMDIGLTLRLTAENLVNSEEFKAIYGRAQNDTQLVTMMFQNILRRAPSSDELRSHLDVVQSPRGGRASLLARLSENPEYIAQVTALTRNVIQVNSLGHRLGTNEAFIAVSQGKFGFNPSRNYPIVSVTICRPGTGVCQTIDDILLDTGSTGLRLLPGAPVRPELQLPEIVNEPGQQLASCVNFGGNTVQQAFWGGLYRADVKIAGLTAAAIPIHIHDTQDNPQFFPIPETCKNGAPVVNAPGQFNGILGIGSPVVDCGTACEAAPIPRYFGCQGTGCAPVRIAVVNQLRNPVFSFGPGYNNGTVISINAVPVEGSSITIGKLVFGIGSQPNNQIGTAAVFPLSVDRTISAVLNGSQYRAIFDSGSPHHLLNDANIPRCPNDTFDFFCPPSPVLIPIVTSSGSSSKTVNIFVVGPSANPLVSAQHTGRYEANASARLIFGLPFYFGRSVFTALDGASTPVGIGPYIAY